MNTNNDNLTELEKANQFNILLLNAKVDVLTALLELIYKGHGSTPDKFRTQFEKMTDAFVQKYLEKIEGQFPKLACEIDLRKKMPEIDQDFLDKLKFGDEKS